MGYAPTIGQLATTSESTEYQALLIWRRLDASVVSRACRVLLSWSSLHRRRAIASRRSRLLIACPPRQKAVR